MAVSQAFVDALVSANPAAELRDADNIFDFLIGSWALDAVLSGADGGTQRTKGELHASWVLEGRAIQDLFIYPRRADRVSGPPVQGDRYATTIRTYDRRRETWRVTFINPAAPETNAQLAARRQGSDIVLEGTLADGTPIRWRYDTITADSFHYTAQRADKDSWRLYLELFGTRTASRESLHITADQRKSA